ncbi:hypothetical protein AZ66_28765 [Paenibacillus sp. E194]|uniref:hypothetical protein n=1 Tax=Paenibacillus sp. E194 TaxID=1458845 RepID=UPI0005C860C7|nr:hypothetical protein [Paenibacillus sp. E194]KJB84788.1 hypothetical protein AZ66_28765 [Paenibacillus sp. E194]
MKKVLSSILILLVTMLSAGTSFAGNNINYEYDANGNLIRKSTVNVADSAYFSGWNNDTHYQFHGNIAELKVWNRALQPIEIESEMHKTLTINSNLVYVY